MGSGTFRRTQIFLPFGELELDSNSHFSISRVALLENVSLYNRNSKLLPSWGDIYVFANRMLISVPYRKLLRRTGVSRILQREFNFKGFKIRNLKKKKN